jgi:hypothetical protein
MSYEFRIMNLVIDQLTTYNLKLIKTLLSPGENPLFFAWIES